MKSVWRRFGFLLTTALATLLLEQQGNAANRIVAWGDIIYDVMVTGEPANGAGVLQISSGDFHSIALNHDGSVLAWGDNRFGQTAIPDVVLETPSAQIAAGNIHNLALMHDGTVVGWGPAPGQAGDYGQCYVPSGMGHAVSVAAGAVHSLALGKDGKVWAWGLNMNGQCNVPFGLQNVMPSPEACITASRSEPMEPLWRGATIDRVK